jgi:hypothetical protein
MAIFCGSLQCPDQPFDLHCMCRTGTPMTAQQPQEQAQQPEQPEGRRRRLLQETQPGMEQQQPEMQCQEVACLAVGHNVR